MLKRIYDNSRITLYAEHGRVSNKRIESTIDTHIANNNYNAANKAINEYEANIKRQYAQSYDKIKTWRKQVSKANNKNADIQRYKQEVLSSNNDNNNDDVIKKPKYRIIKKI